MSAKNLTLSVGGDVITPVEVVRDLGVYLDTELTMKHHVTVLRANVSFSSADFFRLDVSLVLMSQRG